MNKKWFIDNQIQVFDWPVQSPDLNSIQHLWNKVDRRLRKLPTSITSKEDLWIKIEEVWNGIEVDFCQKIIETMPERICDVIKAKGGYTKW